MMADEQFPSDHVPINRAKVESIDLYEVTDDELVQLEKGSDGSLFLNLSLFLISASISFFIALSTTTITSDRQYTVFAIIAIGCLIGSVILALLWWRSRESVSSVVARIRARMKAVEELGDSEESNTATNKEA
jgi:hypothetical protein